jgi:hypothetical protein
LLPRGPADVNGVNVRFIRAVDNRTHGVVHRHDVADPSFTDMLKKTPSSTSYTPLSDRFRRVLPVASRPGEGSLTEPTPAVQVVRDPEARYWGGPVEELSLVPLGEARLGRIGLDEWLRCSQAKA